MAEDLKKQHIVPQSYLNRFGQKNDKGSFIIGTRYNSNKSKPILFEQNVYNVGYIKNYYDYEQLEDPKFWERFFSENIDSFCGRPLSNIIAKITLAQSNDNIISLADKAVLSEIIFSQSVKTPDFFEKCKDIIQKTIAEVKQELIQTDKNLTKEEKAAINSIVFDDADCKETTLEIVFGKKLYTRVCNILLNKTWLIFYNTCFDKMPSITSDNPVVYINADTQKIGLVSNGVASNSTIIYFAVSPRIVIALYPDKMFPGFKENFDSKRYYIDDVKFFTNLNMKTIEQSHQYSFLPLEFFRNI